MSYFEQAKKKLDGEAKAGKFDKYGNAMKSEVLKALKEFCSQSEVFAEAVVKGKSFEECMKAVGKGVSGGSISDLKAYQLAVKYYMSDADVRFCMEIRTGKEKQLRKEAADQPLPAPAAKEAPAPTAAAEPAKQEEPGIVMIDLDKFF